MSPDDISGVACNLADASRDFFAAAFYLAYGKGGKRTALGIENASNEFNQCLGSVRYYLKKLDEVKGAPDVKPLFGGNYEPR